MNGLTDEQRNAGTNASIGATGRLFRRVARRVGLARWGRHAFRIGVTLAIAFAILLLLSRGFGWFESWMTPWALGAIPIIALLTAAATRPRTVSAEVAHLIDERTGTKGLFLAAHDAERRTHRDAGSREFDGVVNARAAARAAAVDPRQVVRFEWWPRLRTSLLVAVTLLAGVLFLPGLSRDQVDPDELHRKRLEATVQTTRARASVVERDPTREDAEAAERDLEEVAKQLRALGKRPGTKHQAAIRKMRAGVTERWKKLRQNARTRGAAWSKQQFGGVNRDRQEAWRKELAAGKTDALRKALTDLKRQIEALKSQSEDDPNAAEKKKQLEQQLKAMADFAANQLGNQSMSDTLARAAEQLGLSDRSALAQQALEALNESLDLAQSELSDIAKALEATRALEEALRALQLANQLAQDDKKAEGDSEALRAQSMKELIQRYQEQLDGG